MSGSETPVLQLAADCRIDDALQAARQAGLERLDALLLLGHAIGRSRTELIAHGTERLTAAQAERAVFLLSQRAAGIPVAYLIGQREFHGLMLRITPDVLDPRPDTEVLVDWALELMDTTMPPEAPNAMVAVRARRSLVDLGTGSGAVALALQRARPAWVVHATDASAAALAVARSNAQAHDSAVVTHEGRWWEPLNGLRFDLAVSNPPYIAPEDPHLPALRHEPRSALVAQESGLQDLRILIEGAPTHLHPGGWLLLEHGHEQGQAVAQLLRQAGFEAIGHRLDLAGHTRCTGGRLAG